ncbi:hypothetical protein B0T24DRAFT_676720 [Lasiosphaeria ovina]|uniref:Uncharacterized protein n=1 Tax=Lasiosphaeria ovina TaxID=92902 RepID=A0AAE0KGI6_9PEZI|nr:hypothetical protein B0T24DRAFT_676720 [Lasiosphaeria ovina]
MASTSQARQGKTPPVPEMKDHKLLFWLVAVNNEAIEICKANKPLVVPLGIESNRHGETSALGISPSWGSKRVSTLLAFDKSSPAQKVPHFGLNHCYFYLRPGTRDVVNSCDELPLPEQSPDSNKKPTSKYNGVWIQKDKGCTGGLDRDKHRLRDSDPSPRHLTMLRVVSNREQFIIQIGDATFRHLREFDSSNSTSLFCFF